MEGHEAGDLGFWTYGGLGCTFRTESPPRMVDDVLDFGNRGLLHVSSVVVFGETGQKVRIMKEGENAREGDLFTRDRAGKHVPV
jgi:hypothetical protein